MRKSAITTSARRALAVAIRGSFRLPGRSRTAPRCPSRANTFCAYAQSLRKMAYSLRRRTFAS